MGLFLFNSNNFAVTAALAVVCAPYRASEVTTVWRYRNSIIIIIIISSILSRNLYYGANVLPPKGRWKVQDKKITEQSK